MLGGMLILRADRLLHTIAQSEIASGSLIWGRVALPLALQAKQLPHLLLVWLHYARKIITGPWAHHSPAEQYIPSDP
jgi:hypothetical protein